MQDKQQYFCHAVETDDFTPTISWSRLCNKAISNQKADKTHCKQSRDCLLYYYKNRKKIMLLCRLLLFLCYWLSDDRQLYWLVAHIVFPGAHMYFIFRVIWVLHTFPLHPSHWWLEGVLPSKATAFCSPAETKHSRSVIVQNYYFALQSWLRHVKARVKKL